MLASLDVPLTAGNERYLFTSAAVLRILLLSAFSESEGIMTECGPSITKLSA